MDASLFLARLIGPLYLAAGLGLLLNPTYYRDMLKSLPAGGLAYYLSGAIALLAGLAILQFHNLWVADWRVIFTLIGWLGLAKGVLLLVLPKQAIAYVAWVGSAPILRGAAAFCLLLGAWITYQGYLA